MPPFVSLVMVDTDETMGSLFVSSSINVAYGSSIIPAISLARSNNVRFVTSLGAGRYEIGKPISGSGDVVFISSLSGYVDDLDTVTVGNQQNIILPRLSVRATVTGQTPTTLTVSCSVVDPLNAPAFSLGFTREPATSTIGIVGTNPFIINKPFGTDVVKVNFTATQVNRQSDSDPVIVNPIPAFLSLLMVPINETQLVLRVSSSVNESPNGSTPTIVLSSATGLMSSSMVSPGVFDLFKNINGAGFATFRATLAGFTEDYDTVTVGNQTDLDLPRLTIRATVTAETSQNMTISCSVFDPVGTPNFTITTSKEPAISPISITGTNPFVVTKPIGSGSAKVNFIATQPNRVLDIDVQVIPNVTQPSLVINTFRKGNTAATYTYNVSVVDTIPETPIQLLLLPSNAAIVGSSRPIIDGSLIVSSSEVIEVTIQRPSFTFGIGRVALIATSSRRIDGTDAIDVSERGIESSDASSAYVGAATYGITPSLANITFDVPAASSAQSVEVYALEYDTQPLSSASVQFIGTQIKESPFIRTTPNSSIFYGTIPLFKPANWMVVTLVPFDALNRRGAVVNSNILVIPSSVATPPNAFTARANTATTTTTITNTVTLPATNLPTSIRVYRDDIVFDNITVVVGAGAVQTMVHTDLAINTVYIWSYAPILAGVEGTRTANLTVSTQNIASVLLAPSASFIGPNGRRIQFSIDNAVAYPVGTTFTGQFRIGVGSYTSLGIASTTLLQSGPLGATSMVLGDARFFAVNSGFTTSPASPLIAWSFDGGRFL